MSDLIERLERASGPDRELDIEICRLTCGEGWRVTDSGNLECYGDMGGDYDPNWYPSGAEIPHFTASLDDAMMLQEPGAEYEITNLYGIADVKVGLNMESMLLDWPPHIRRNDGNVILALCQAWLQLRADVAALKARQTA